MTQEEAIYHLSLALKRVLDSNITCKDADEDFSSWVKEAKKEAQAVLEVMEAFTPKLFVYTGDEMINCRTGKTHRVIGLDSSGNILLGDSYGQCFEWKLK